MRLLDSPLLRTTTLFFVLITTTWTLHGQHPRPQLPEVTTARAHPTGDAERSAVLTAPLARVVTREDAQVRWQTRVGRIGERRHHLPEVEALKAAKLAGKQASYDPALKPVPGSPKAVTPMLGNNFEGNWSVQLTPPDNSLAISNGGQVVSANNDGVAYYNTSGSLLYGTAWPDFFNDPSLTSTIYDPKVIYDSGADRFVLVVLHGSTSPTSKVLLCFSQTNDPNDGWWVYQLPGNVLGNNTWFDYPALGVSNNEVYITGNMFTNGGSFDQSIVFQVQKAAGYAGLALNWIYWFNLDNSPYEAFTLQPASWGQQGNYGPGILFVSGRSSGSNQVRVWDLTDDLIGTPQLNAYTSNTTAYSPAANANQAGHPDLLDNGDCRIMNAFYLNNRLHFVFHTDVGSGWNGLRYNRMDITNLVNQQVSLGTPGTADLSYPAVASFSSSISDHSVMIGFLRTAPGLFPEVGVVNCDNALQWSPTTLVKAGQTFVNFLPGSTERWGDYSGMSRKHNSAPPTVWMSGCYGANVSGVLNNTWKTWITEVGGSGSVAVSEAWQGAPTQLYPNPVSDLFRLRFIVERQEPLRIELNDMQGRLVKLLYADSPRPGEHLLTFNRGALTSGTYVLSLRTPTATLSHEMLVVD